MQRKLSRRLRQAINILGGKAMQPNNQQTSQQVNQQASQSNNNQSNSNQSNVSHVVSKPIPAPLKAKAQRGWDSRSISSNKAVGIVIWLFGAWMTSQLLRQTGMSDPYNAVIGFALQFALTKAESPLWRGEGMPKMALGAVVVDIAVNSAGIWPYVKNLGHTDFWSMVRDITEAATLEPTKWTLMALSLGAGAFTAAAAEYFWSLD